MIEGPLALIGKPWVLHELQMRGRGEESVECDSTYQPVDPLDFRSVK